MSSRLKRGTSDNVQQQSRIGTVRQDATGRTWREVRTLIRDAYENIMLNAAFDIRFKNLTDKHRYDPGYDLMSDRSDSTYKKD